MSLTMLGIGTAVPPHRIAQVDSAVIARQISCESPSQNRLLETIYRRSSVEFRHSVVLERSDAEVASRQVFFGASNPSTLDRMKRYENEAEALALAAAIQALSDANLPPHRITHLVTVSCTGFYAPGFDLALMAKLPLAADVSRTHVGFMGCHGALNGLRVAKAFVEADPNACVLLCAVELCSLHMQYGWDPEQIVANALFADGAAAVVATGRDVATTNTFRLIASGSTLIPGTADAMSWKIEDHGFAMTLSPRVPALIGAHLLPWLESWLSEQGQSLARIGSWAIHPGGPRILSAVMEVAALDRSLIEPSLSVLRDFGNMSSATILFILDRLRSSKAARPCVALAFGPGLSVEVALLV
jgi:predicted naringenin-chalcone synthase